MRNLSRNEFTRNLSGNIRPQSSQLTEPLWTDPGIKNEISVRELISTSTTKKERKKERKTKKGIIGERLAEHLTEILASEENATMSALRRRRLWIRSAKGKEGGRTFSVLPYPVIFFFGPAPSFSPKITEESMIQDVLSLLHIGFVLSPQ